MNNKCPFCPIQRLPECPWYLKTEDGIIVCEDLDLKQFKYRLLIVGSGTFWHRPKSQYSEQEIKRMVELGEQVFQKIKKGNEEIVGVDDSLMKFPQHFHIQLIIN